MVRGGTNSFSPYLPLPCSFYAMREAINIACEEGLNALYKRHTANHERLWDNLSAMGLEPYVENKKDRLVTVNTIKVPEGVDWAKVLANAMDNYRVEIAGGLGPTVGKVCVGGGRDCEHGQQSCSSLTLADPIRLTRCRSSVWDAWDSMPGLRTWTWWPR